MIRRVGERLDSTEQRERERELMDTGMLKRRKVRLSEGKTVRVIEKKSRTCACTVYTLSDRGTCECRE